MNPTNIDVIKLCRQLYHVPLIKLLTWNKGKLISMADEILMTIRDKFVHAQ